VSGTRWEAIDPEQACTDPTGHRMIEDRDLCDPAPRIWCSTCGAEASVLVIPTEPDDGHEHEWLSLTTVADAWGDGHDRYQCIHCNEEQRVPVGERP